MKDIAIFGAGGLGREVACLLRLINEKKREWNFIGFIDDSVSLWGTENKYGRVLGGTDWLNRYEKLLAVVVAVGSSDAIHSIVSRILNPCVYFPNIFAPTVTFLDRESIELGQGNIFCSNCLVSCNVHIGNFNLFNGNIPIGHDVKIGDYNVVMPSVNISGGVTIGDRNFLGVQSVVLQYLKIGNHVRLGANSVMMHRPQDGFMYIGNPAKRIKL
ncbi:MAG: serine acetyltransferase [Bacteroidaceae bacterium]|nr:serine acetyltransferase [Bacteroidaceae bacterium]